MRETETDGAEREEEKQNQEEGNRERHSIPHQEERTEDRPWMTSLLSELCPPWSVKKDTEQEL